MDIIFIYLSKASLITLVVLGWLSLYFILSFTILFSRILGLNSWISKENNSLESLLLGTKIRATDSILQKFTRDGISKQKIEICKSLAKTKSTSGLTMLSIIASTSPFIGLFGTVVGILQTFYVLGSSGDNSLNAIAPAISEALVATGCGIFVAIPAYSFNLLIKRKAFELLSIIDREASILLEQENE